MDLSKIENEIKSEIERIREVLMLLLNITSLSYRKE